MKMSNTEKQLKKILVALTALTALTSLTSHYLERPFLLKMERKQGIRMKLAELKKMNLGLVELDCKLAREGRDISEYLVRPEFKIYDFKKPETSKNNNHNKSKNIYLAPEFGFYTEKSFEQMIDFYRRNEKFLREVEKNNNIRGAAKYIVATYQIESNFGKKTGRRHVFNTLVSMYVQNHRKDFAYNELKDFLSLQGELYEDIFEIKGSKYGAFGDGQMIASTYKKSYRDFNGDGKANIFCREDAMGFIADYFAKSGFRENPRKALHLYNHSWKYVDAIETVAKELGTKLEQKKKRGKA